MPRPARDDLTKRILTALPGRQAEIARAVGRKPSDGTVRRRLGALLSAGEVEQVDGVFARCQDVGNERQPDGAGLPDGYEFPPGFDATARVQFEVQLVELTTAGVVVDSLDIDLIERYVTALQRARTAQSSLDDDGLLTSARSGRRFTHPAVAIVREAERDAQVYMDSLRRRAGGDGVRGRSGAADGNPFDLR